MSSKILNKGWCTSYLITVYSEKWNSVNSKKSLVTDRNTVPISIIFSIIENLAEWTEIIDACNLLCCHFLSNKDKIGKISLSNPLCPSKTRTSCSFWQIYILSLLFVPEYIGLFCISNSWNSIKCELQYSQNIRISFNLWFSL